MGTSSVAVTITSDGNTAANVLSRCQSLNGNRHDSCLECFFGHSGSTSSFRSSNEITYDSTAGICTEIDGVDEYEYIYSYNGCENSSMWSDAYDNCERCMKGQNNEIATVDGFGADNDFSGIQFVINYNDYDYYDCDIIKSSLIMCANGWYGFPESEAGNPLYGCSKCPATGLSNVSASSNNTYGRTKSITDCYISQDTPIKDSVGTYVYTSNCYYKP